MQSQPAYLETGAGACMYKSPNRRIVIFTLVNVDNTVTARMVVVISRCSSCIRSARTACACLGPGGLALYMKHLQF